MPSTRTLRVAAVQMESRNGMIRDNLTRATRHVEAAAADGARLVLMPELMPTGYLLARALWDAAEPPQGPTVAWLRRQSKALGIWLGTSFLEADEDDFFNSFVLTDPRGEEVGRVRKCRPAMSEAYLFAGASGPRVFATPLGRIGIAICYENFLCDVVRALHAEAADLVLMPLSAPTGTVSWGFSQRDVDAFNAMVEDIPRRIAGGLGVPTVMANKSGPWRSPLPWPYPAQDSRFPGLSAIIDGDGTELRRLDDEEGVIVADVALDPARKAAAPPTGHGRWSRPMPWFTRVWISSEWFGSLSYALSGERRRRARAVARGVPIDPP